MVANRTIKCHLEGLADEMATGPCILRDGTRESLNCPRALDNEVNCATIHAQAIQHSMVIILKCGMAQNKFGGRY